MEGLSLAIAAASLVATVAGAYFGWAAIRRRKPPGPAARPAPGAGYDLYISYAPADTDQARKLAGRLMAAGLRPFLVEWLEPGVIETLGVEDAMSCSAHAVLLYSHASRGDPVMDEEYAALLGQTRRTGNRFIPAMIEKVRLPAFAAIRIPLDLTGGDPARYDAEVGRLIVAIRPGAAI